MAMGFHRVMSPGPPKLALATGDGGRDVAQMLVTSPEQGGEDLPQAHLEEGPEAGKFRQGFFHQGDLPGPGRPGASGRVLQEGEHFRAEVGTGLGCRILQTSFYRGWVRQVQFADRSIACTARVCAIHRR